MASLGQLHLGASADDFGVSHPTAIACALLAPFKDDMQWSGIGGDWLVTAKKGHGYISARTSRVLSLADTRREGILALVQALDLFSVHMNRTSNLSKAGDNFIALFQEGDKQVLCFTATFDFPISINFSAEVRDKGGNIKPMPEPPPPSWHRSFRYYRLSQLAADVYEAYRNLYLSFETLAESCYPRQGDEREGAWIRRCFQEFHLHYGLSTFAPTDHRAPNEYLFGTLYENTRCNLFHSRTTDAILPYYEVDAFAVHDAYETLLRIWRHIAVAVLGTRSGGSVVTYQGYRLWMGNAFGQLLAVVVADDASPAKESDTSVSPSGLAASMLSRCRYAGEVTPGIVRVEAGESDPQSLPLIRRLALQINDTLYAVSVIDGGLNLRGVDRFDVVLNQRLIQGGQPKVTF